MEKTSPVMKVFSFFTSAQTTKILGCFRCIIVELEDNLPSGLAIDGDVHEHIWEGLSWVTSHFLDNFIFYKMFLNILKF